MNGNLPSFIAELWSLFSVINVKTHYASEPSPGYLDITREFRMPPRLHEWNSSSGS